LPPKPTDRLADRPTVNTESPPNLSLGHTKLVQVRRVLCDSLVHRERIDLEDVRFYGHRSYGSNSSRSRPPRTQQRACQAAGFFMLDVANRDRL